LFSISTLAADPPERFNPETFYGGPQDTGLFAETPGRWPVKKANEWYARQPWLIGVNFLPSTAVNDVEMWQAENFDAATIERELSWARGLGFNTVRVFLNYVVWEADGLKQRFDRFLAISVYPLP